ncbi:50S ribosomal protein L25/general stress protein Ctc [Tenacibaculum ovolyticum]|uniref:50S ribosomal protein L25/general stress protein Ctc n=1 Tax=Tenacibaculum ovolyticum TaxID=104270 RepID=UPI000403E3B5|nr:50S ribosomal protein L25/general stress protein Ctc [Tenacibaculum ovolyticum]WBX76763.1 50S ribosomal protein L25/general stress protein Ctc [Tenacibaculum ovolyticum]
MKSITINGSQRESVGKKATKALRNAGKVPCVLYGGDKPVHFSAEEKSFKPLVFTPDVFTASIEIDGKKYSAVLQDIQFHPVTDRIIHVDFYQLFDDKMVTMNIPVKLAGTSPGVLNGGALRFTNRKLKVKALPANLPDFLTADISGLKIGNKLFISSLFNDDYTFLHPDNTVVVQVRTSRNATAEEETEEATTEAAAE